MNIERKLYHRDRYNRLKDEHRCTKCCAQDAHTLAGYVECYECAEKATSFSSNHVNMLKLENRCVRCGRQDILTLSGKVYCESCANKYKEAYKKKRRSEMKAIIVPPLKEAYVKDIKSDLKTLQELVGGDIEIYYPFDDACIICNEEGKMNGSMPSRAILGDSGELRDVIFGTFIICGIGKEDFKSINKKTIAKYLEKYLNPEQIYYADGHIHVIKMTEENVKNA